MSMWLGPAICPPRGANGGQTGLPGRSGHFIFGSISKIESDPVNLIARQPGLSVSRVSHLIAQAEQAKGKA